MNTEAFLMPASVAEKNQTVDDSGGDVKEVGALQAGFICPLTIKWT